ncbi:hypothetical protein DGo_CA1220 [Deinococcus gobiensis I-0]|uniref:Uncharacterized protein n=1 Tax=Deinococcus gobiensis (strain DSM 21396 / JCM 16679 / CGMCC 1.7299 / I-0) TaxID=745776 RepID=H8GRV0_DEIGI|nr:hypothetical protein DGo_CA1220 [Deinococcus gobiensis I-0]
MQFQVEVQRPPLAHARGDGAAQEVLVAGREQAHELRAQGRVHRLWGQAAARDAQDARADIDGPEQQFLGRERAFQLGDIAQVRGHGRPVGRGGGVGPAGRAKRRWAAYAVGASGGNEEDRADSPEQPWRGW